MRGLSLVEVMVAMTIGLVVLLGVIGIMGANRQNLRITESLSESQENARMAFELIARDVRQARDTSCGAIQGIGNLNTQWWGIWRPIQGFAGTDATTAVAIGSAANERVTNTQALQLLGSGEVRIIKTITGATLELQTAAGSLNGGPVIVCDLQTASLHTVTAAAAATITLAPAVVVSSVDSPQFQVARLTAVTWYIGNNGRADEGGRSLFRVSLLPNGRTATEEILPGVVNMGMRYHVTGGADFIAESAVADWDTVNAIELTLTAESTQRNVTSDATPGSDLVGSDGRIRRQITHVITLRNTI
jgi:type IV pilus assembly protein PilW